MVHVLMCRDSPVGIATGLRAGLSGVRIQIGRLGINYSLLQIAQPPIQWIPGALRRMKLPSRDVGYSPATSAQVKNECP
jgi:hypothetical protein